MSKDQKSLNVLVYWLASAFGSEAELIIIFFIMKMLIDMWCTASRIWDNSNNKKN